MRWFARKQHDRVVWSLVGVMALALIDSQAVGQCEIDKLLASDGGFNDRFGKSVSITGSLGNEVAIVGAYLDDDNGASSGSAYIYRRYGAIWDEEAKLLASDGLASDFFGTSVSISGSPGNEIAIVGANNHSDNGQWSGAAYIYRFNGTTWEEEEKLLASDATEFDYFGISVSIFGDPGSEVAIVGAAFDNNGGIQSGSAYIFRFDGASWIEETELLASDRASGDNFGRTVSICGASGNEVAIVGAYFDVNNGSIRGSAYIYRFNGATWVEEAKLLASDGAALDYFARSVSISGAPGNEIAIVGSYQDDDNGTDSGSAYIYRFNGVSWIEEAKLLASDGEAGDQLGYSVSISGDSGSEVAIVGAYLDDFNGSGSGSAYIYRKSGVTWVEDVILLASDAAVDDNFGFSVSISGDIAFVGSWQDDDNGLSSGSAYTYVGLSDCNGNDVLDCLDIASGTSSDINMNFVIDDCELLVYNTTAAMYHTTIDDAIRNAVNGDVITASPLNFFAEPDIDFFGKDITLSSLTYITQTPGGLYTLAAGSTLAAAAGGDITLNGELRILSGEAADVIANQLTMSATSELSLRNNSALFVTGAAGLDGQTLMLSWATLDVDGALTTGGTLTALQSTLIGTTIANTGIVNATNLTLVADSFANTASGSLIGYGTLFAPVTNDGAITCIGDTVAVGDYLNNALAITTVQVGTLTIVGNLTNFGTIFGNISVPPSAAKAAGAVAQSGDGMSISGNYTAGATTSLMMPDEIWVFGVGGDFDVAINDNTNYDMRLAQLRMDGLSGVVQILELMSLDIGADSDGLDRSFAGHYPIGTLRIGPNATTVTLVDNHDNANDGQLGCEALYVENLIVNAGATLNTNGCPVYYEILVLNGLVDDPLNLIALPLCLADVNDDNSVNVIDLLAMLAAWGPNPGHPADLNDDGNVTVLDLLAMLAAWGACP